MDYFQLIPCFPCFLMTRGRQQLPVTVGVVVFINPTISIHLPSVRVATIYKYVLCSTLVLCAADVFSLERDSFPPRTLFPFSNCRWACVESRWAAAHGEYQRPHGSEILLISRVWHYGPCVISTWVWMRPDKTLNHVVRLNHRMATFQLLSPVISNILFLCVPWVSVWVSEGL